MDIQHAWDLHLPLRVSAPAVVDHHRQHCWSDHRHLYSKRPRSEQKGLRHLLVASRTCIPRDVLADLHLTQEIARGSHRTNKRDWARGAYPRAVFIFLTYSEPPHLLIHYRHLILSNAQILNLSA